MKRVTAEIKQRGSWLMATWEQDFVISDDEEPEAGVRRKIKEQNYNLPSCRTPYEFVRIVNGGADK
jgi:hypothetical protein